MNFVFEYLTVLLITSIIGVLAFGGCKESYRRAVIALVIYVTVVEFSLFIFPKRFLFAGSNSYPQYNVVLLAEFIIYFLFFQKGAAFSKKKKNSFRYFVYFSDSLVFVGLWFVQLFRMEQYYFSIRRFLRHTMLYPVLRRNSGRFRIGTYKKKYRFLVDDRAICFLRNHGSVYGHVQFSGNSF